MGYEVSRESCEAQAGAALSRACVRLPKVLGEHIIGPVNADRHLPGVYPLTPLRYYVAATKAWEVQSWAEFPGDPAAGQWPKDYPTAGIVSAPIAAVHKPSYEYGLHARPAVAWAYGEHVLWGEIPADVVAQTEGEVFRFTSRIGRGVLKIAPGLIDITNNQFLAAYQAQAEAIVPAADVPADIAAAF